MDEPRAANIVAVTPRARVVTLDRYSFDRLIGPLDHLLNVNMQTYGQGF
jgi:CRP-like cAMP-binding protein